MSGAALGLVALGLLTSSATFAHAQERVITPGREAEIQALFQPHVLGSEVVPGWTLNQIAIFERSIRVVVIGEAGRGALVLSEPAGDRAAPSFAVSEEGDAASASARAALLEALRANDAGSFWATAVVPGGTGGATRGASPIPSRTTPWVPVGLAIFAVVACALLVLRQRSSRGPAA